MATRPSLARDRALWPKEHTAMAGDGTELAYTVLGDGDRTPVVFMNGWTCPDAYWRRIVPPVLEAGHRVVLFDTRGHGESSLPRDPGFMARNLRPDDVSVTRLADDIADVLDAAGIERAVLAGHSMGVQAIFEAWRRHADRVAGLVPVAGTYENPVPTFAEKAVLDRLFPIGDALLSRLPFELAQPVMSHAHRLPRAWTMKVLRTLRVANASVVYEDVQPHVEQIGEANFSVLWRMMSGMRHHSAADLLPTITAPVLILGGTKDTFTPPSVQHRMHSLIPGSELVLFPDGGHLLPVEEADGVARALVEWLRRRVEGRGRRRRSQ
jgi:pimeloyl-ACP methyl ester carboxylesterase